MSFGINNKDRTQWQLERIGGYDKHGHVFSIARPLTGSVSFPVKTFPSTAALEQFINEYTFFRYRGRCPTWRSVLNKGDCLSDEERDTGTLKGKNYTPEGGKDYVIQLISSGELVVHRTGSWIPSQDRNHHLPWPKSATEKEEFLPPSRTMTLGPHEEPGYEPPLAVKSDSKTSGDTSMVEVEDLGSGKILANNITDFIVDGGRLGGESYDPKKLEQLKGYLDRRGIKLKVGDEFVPFGKAGGFDASQGVLVLRDNPTNYEVWHELSHFRQYQKLGKEAYLNLPRTKAFHAPEQFVFDMLENSPKRWNALNFNEQQHAIRYIENMGGFR